MIFGVPSRTARAALRLIAAFFLVNGHSRVFRGFIGLGFTEVLSETLPELLGSVLRFMAPIQILWPTSCIIRTAPLTNTYVVPLFMWECLLGTVWKAVACSCTIPVNYPEFSRDALRGLTPRERVGREVGSLRKRGTTKDIGLQLGHSVLAGVVDRRQIMMVLMTARLYYQILF